MNILKKYFLFYVLQMTHDIFKSVHAVLYNEFYNEKGG
ncbi:hypothetical protein CBC_A1780 [Clostridium botulinum C str. Eklund]|nr:hypothetical protein CBC_A1780 [Clostridium botulinum C str. Eklund]